MRGALFGSLPLFLRMVALWLVQVGMLIRGFAIRVQANRTEGYYIFYSGREDWRGSRLNNRGGVMRRVYSFNFI